MSKLFENITIVLIFFSAMAGLAMPALAQSGVNGNTGSDIAKQLQATGGSTGAGYGMPEDPRLTAAKIIRTILNILGIIVLCLILYSGFLWMTAGGNEDQVTKAKAWMRNSVIGLIVIFAAYSITYFAIKIALNQYYDANQPSLQVLPNYQPVNNKPWGP